MPNTRSPITKAAYRTLAIQAVAVAAAGGATALFVWRMHYALGLDVPAHVAAWRLGVLLLCVALFLLDWVGLLGFLRARATGRPVRAVLLEGAVAFYPALLLGVAYIPLLRDHASFLEMLSVIVVATVAGLHAKLWSAGRALRRGVWVFFAASLIAYVLVLGLASWQRHLAFMSNALDMGMMDQVLWNLTHGRGFYTSYKGFSFLGDHFSPALVALVPFYWLTGGRGVLALVLAQSALIAVSAGTLFVVARSELHSLGLAAAMAVSFLLQPLLHEANLFDFHPDVLALPFMILAFYFLRRRQNRALAVSLFVALLAKEDVALFGVALGLYAFLGLRRRRLGVAIVAGNLLWLGAVVGFLIPHFSAGHGTYVLWWRYGYLGRTPQEMVATLSAHPQVIVAQVLTASRAQTLGLLLVPLGGLPLLGGSAILLVLPALAVNLLSQYLPQATLHMHYALLVYPPLYLAAIVGLRRRLAGRSGPTLQRHRLFWAGFLLAGGVAMSYYASPLGRWRQPELFAVDRHARTAQELLQHVPPQATLSAQSNLAAHLSERPQIQLFPDTSDAEFVALDTVTYNRYPADDKYLQTVASLLQAGAYGVVWEREGFLLLQHGAPTAGNAAARDRLYEFQEGFLYRRSWWGGKIVADPQATDGRALLAEAGRHVRGLISRGPYQRFPQTGLHRAEFRLRAGPAGADQVVATADVYNPQTDQVVVSRDLRGVDFPARDYQTFALSFNNAPDQPLEFRLFFADQTNVWIDNITFR